MSRKRLLSMSLWCWLGTAIAATILLNGCGFLSGPSDYKNYSAALSEHATAESNRIGAQSQAIVSSLLTAAPKTDTERSLLAVIGMMEISRLHPSTLGIIKPTTGYDVLDHNLSPIFGTVLTGALGYWSYDAIKSMGQTPGNVFNLGKGDVNATDSFNPTTVTMHQTYSSGGVQKLNLTTKRENPALPEVTP